MTAAATAATASRPTCCCCRADRSNYDEGGEHDDWSSYDRETANLVLRVRAPPGPLALPSQCTACKRRPGNALIQPDCDSFNRFPVPTPQVLTSKAAQRLLTQLGVRRGGWLTAGGVDSALCRHACGC